MIITESPEILFGKAFLPMVVLFVGYNIIAGFYNQVDNSAHIGGLISGFLLGTLLSGKLKKEEKIAVE